MPKRYVGMAPFLLLVSALAVLTLAAACGDDDDGSNADNGGDVAATVGELEIISPSARANPKNISVAYMTIVNNGDEPDRLLSVTSDLSGMAQIHETVSQGASESMQQVEDGLEIPAHGEVKLETGGYHVMLMNLDAPLQEGDDVHLTLSFEKAGEVTVHVPVLPYTSDGGN